LIVALTALVLIEPPVVQASAASVTKAPARQMCSSCVRCECCMERGSAPALPMSVPISTRTEACGDLQFLGAAFMCLAPRRVTLDVDLSSVTFAFFPATAPLYQRHCAYLI
jgi:hypothetical protein